MWRLKRGRDFSCTPKQFGQEVQGIAARLGKVARSVVDRNAPMDYVWVQFAEAMLERDDICTCGSARFRRTHTYFVRCEACGRQLMLSNARGQPGWDFDPDDEEDDLDLEGSSSSRSGAGVDSGMAPAGDPLAGFSRVRLSLAEEGTGRRRYVGYGLDHSEREVLLVVSVPLADGAPMRDSSTSLGMVSTVCTLDLEPVRLLIDRSWFEKDAWDIELP